MRGVGARTIARETGEATRMTDANIDELGPVDYLVVEFPAGQAHFTGEMATELAALVDAGTVRVLDLLILQKGADGSVEAAEIDDLDAVDELRALEAERRGDPRRRGRRTPRGGHGAGQCRRRSRVREPVGGTVRLSRSPVRRPTHREWPNPHPSPHRLPGSRPIPHQRRSLTCRCDLHELPDEES